MRNRLATCVLLLLCLALEAAEEPGATSLIDLAESLQAVNDDNYRAHLELSGVVTPGAEKPRSLRLDFSCVGGEFRGGTGRAPDWNQATHEVTDAGGLAIDDEGLGGTVTVVLKPDKWVPKDKQPITIACALAGELSPVAVPTADDSNALVGRWWRLHPGAQGAAYRVVGSVTATDPITGAESRGEIEGVLNRPLAPGAWDMGRPADGGVRFVFNLGSERQNWNYAKLSQYMFPAEGGVDLSAYAGLRLRAHSATPRADCGVTVWLREADGSWYYVKDALPLADPENAIDLRWEDFEEAEWVSPTNHMDEDFRLDTATISHLGIGVVNSLGVGVVDFTLTGVEGLILPTIEPAPVPVRVSGRTLMVNGYDTVPVGLFGGYAPDLPQEFRPGCQRKLHFGLTGKPSIPGPERSEAFIIDCQGERLHSAPYLTRDDWEQWLHRLGVSYGKHAAQADGVAVMEFWNEPYLNWAERSRVNYKVKFFRQDLAEEGGPVAVKRGAGTGTEDLDIVPHFKWVKARPGKVSQTASGLMVIDETAFSYWSGRGNGHIYDAMYRAMASGIKAECPEAICVAGWGFRWHEDHWGAWDLLYKPTIDRNIELIDGVHEHHYQGDPTDVIGSYEVLTAYGVTAHDKWLRSYNTECNDLVDAPARGHVEVPEKIAKQNNKDYRRCIYNLRDILYAVAQSPDKAASRTMIHWNHTETGSRVCFAMLRELRGRLIECTSADPDLWCVASIDGTDPAAPRADGTRALCVILFNDHRALRTVDLEIAAPAGTSFAEGATVQRIAVDRASFAVELVSAPAADVTEAACRATPTLPGRGAWKILLPLTGEPTAEPQVMRRQFFSPDLLQAIAREEPFVTAVAVEPEALAAANQACLRLLVEDLAPGEGTVTVGDQELILPQAFTRNNGNRIVELPLPVAAVAAKTPVTFALAPGNHAGYRVDMCSLVLEIRSE